MMKAALGAALLAALGVAVLMAAAVSHTQSQSAHAQELMQAVPAQRELENFEVRCRLPALPKTQRPPQHITDVTRL